MKKSIKDLKIFIGHSIVDFSDNISELVGFLNDTVAQQFNTTIETYVCEERCASSQDEINQYITNKADLAVFCFINKVGEFSFEEYKVALDAYKNSDFNHPKIAVYFKSGVEETQETKDKIMSDRIYYNDFENLEAIKLDLLLLLKSLSKESLNFQISGKDLLINGKRVENLSIKSLPVYKNNKDIAKIDEEINNLTESVCKFQSNGNIEECDKLCNKIADLQKQKSLKLQAILSFSQRFVDDCVNNENDKLIQLARSFVKQGDIEKAIKLFPSLNQLNEESNSIVQIGLDSIALARKEISKYFELIDICILKNINESREEINECAKGILKLVAELKIYDYEIISGLINLYTDKIITIDIDNFLLDLAEEKEVRKDARYYLYVLVQIFDALYYDIDREFYFNKIADAYTNILGEEKTLDNLTVEVEAFWTITNYCEATSNTEMYTKLLTNRIQYAASFKDNDLKSTIDANVMFAQLKLASIYCAKGEREVGRKIVRSNYKKVIETIKESPRFEIGLTRTLASAIIDCEDFENSEEVCDLCLSVAKKLEKSADTYHISLAIELYINAITFLINKAEVSKAYECSLIIDELCKKCVSYNDTKFKIHYVLFLYTKIMCEIISDKECDIVNEIEFAEEVENQLDPKTLKENALYLAFYKFNLSNLLIQLNIYFLADDLSFHSFDLLKKLDLKLIDCGSLMVKVLTAGIISTIKTKNGEYINQIDDYLIQLYNLLLKYKEFLLSEKDFIEIIDVIENFLFELEIEDFKYDTKIKDALSRIINENDIKDKSSRFILNYYDAINKIDFYFKKDIGEFTKEDHDRIYKLSITYCDSLFEISKMSYDEFVIKLNSSYRYITYFMKLLEPIQVDCFVERLYWIIDNYFKTNEFFRLSFRIKFNGAFVCGYEGRKTFVRPLYEKKFKVDFIRCIEKIKSFDDETKYGIILSAMPYICRSYKISQSRSGWIFILNFIILIKNLVIEDKQLNTEKNGTIIIGYCTLAGEFNYTNILKMVDLNKETTLEEVESIVKSYRNPK